ncbi:IS66 family transposase [bacterium]|nr:MAG: IS66 family transposase [bacterium]
MISEVTMEKVQEILARIRAAGFSEEDCKVMETLVESYACLTGHVESKDMTIGRLRAMLFGNKSEKAAEVLGDKNEKTQVGDSADDKKKPKGHGRNGAKEYAGAETVTCPHGTLKSGDECPECKKGKVYPLPDPGLLIRVTGQAPLAATIYELEKLRCNLCSKVFTAVSPEGIGDAKYDERSASMLALLKYGSGLPFYRLQGLQKSLGIPLPTSTQWDIVKELAASLEPVFAELIRQAAQGEVVHNDDTTMKILDYMGKRREQSQESMEETSRVGTFTSGIVSTGEAQKIALFFTGKKHAGENLQDVLKARADELAPPIQMCDALSRNTSPDFEAIVANCLVHSRRKFVEVAGNFPSETRHVLEVLGEVYKNDADTKKQGMKPKQRQRFHWEKSRPLMTPLREWMRKKIHEREVEPNSGLGEAIAYMDKHWKKLTLFLTVPGAPLDNNICEAALKRVILHRKNSLFYRSQKGAWVGDLFMSLISTCQYSKANPFEYLTELQMHTKAARNNPQAWMPWNYLRACEDTDT